MVLKEKNSNKTTDVVIYSHHPISGKLLTDEEDRLPWIGSWDYYWTKGDICDHTWLAVIEDRCFKQIECPFCNTLQTFKVWTEKS